MCDHKRLSLCLAHPTPLSPPLAFPSLDFSNTFLFVTTMLPSEFHFNFSVTSWLTTMADNNDDWMYSIPENILGILYMFIVWTLIVTLCSRHVYYPSLAYWIIDSYVSWTRVTQPRSWQTVESGFELSLVRESGAYFYQWTKFVGLWLSIQHWVTSSHLGLHLPAAPPLPG